MKVMNYNPKYKVMFLAFVVGISTGIVSILFNEVLNMGFVLFEDLYRTTNFFFLMPFVTALLIGSIRHRLLKDNNQGFGVSQVMYEIEHIKTRMMKPTAVMYKTLGTLLTLLSGFSAGRQGPIVHLGGAIGSNIAYQFKLNNDETRVLIGCGVAGCLAGVFNSPIFATLFVVEILFKKRYFDMISTILLSALASTLIVRLFVTDTHFINFQTNYLFHISELFNFVLLGVLMSFFSILYMVTLNKFKYYFLHLQVPQVVKNLMGASVIAFALYFFSIYYIFNPVPGKVLSMELSAGHLYILAFVSILLTAITLGSGGIGGIFAPGLFIGMCAGLALSKTFLLFNLPVLDINTYAIAGMASMFAGFAIAPLSGALMVVELSNQYNLLFPILISTLITSKISEVIVHESIYHKGLNDLLMSDQ